MRRDVAVSASFAVVFAAALVAQQPPQPQQPVGTSGARSTSAHVMITAGEASFSPAPDSLPPGAQLAVLDGDPTASSGTFTLRLKMPDNYLIPPHWHPTDELVTVVEGTMRMGMGEQFSSDGLKSLDVGGFAKMPKGVRHFGQAKGPTIVQISGNSPFAITYVNPGDDPRNKKQ